MFTENVNPRKRGRPVGITAQGEAARRRLFGVAVGLIHERGYEATTLRDVADRAGVSVGLLYKYFPNKRAIVLAMYDELSADYAVRAAELPAGKWRDRFVYALETSLASLAAHRNTLKALIPVMLAATDEGVFGRSTEFSRHRVQKVFQEAVTGAADAPSKALGEPLARLLYLVHLGVILWWLLDKSAEQRATKALVVLLRQVLPSATLTLRLPPIRGFVQSADKLFREALLGSEGS
jgi:AcrR family transcriptional regulator